jgi:hypothetical protein
MSPIHISYLLHEVPSKFFFFSFLFAMSQFDWPITQKMKLLGLPIIEGSILKHRVLSLWPTYIGEMRVTFAKEYGINVRCYWELFGEHVKNLGTLSFEPPPTPTCMESEQSTVHYPHQSQLETSPAPLTHKKKREGSPVTPRHNFSLVACKSYS